jgi:hypothetical protein
VICPVCGEKGGACHGSVPVRLTADQLADIGLKPEDLKPGGTISMADQTEPKSRYPKQEVAEGQKHGYIGDVETYDPPQSEPGYSNAKTTTTKQSAKDVTPAEKPIAGATGLVGGTVDNVKAPKA